MHLNDWLDDGLILTKGMLLGYPRIPFSRGSDLVAVETEVNAIIDRYDCPHPHFILSNIPRGGFSGGPVFSQFGFLLGLFTESLYEGNLPNELGFGAAVSVEPILAILAENSIFPGGNAEVVKAFAEL